MQIPKSRATLTEKLGINEYQLVILLSKRVRELMYGAKPLVEGKDSSFIEIAIKELLDGRITLQS